MSCNCNRLCNHLVISDDVTFNNDTLSVNIPQAAYENDQRYCIVVAQNIPEETTITAPVNITIGADTTTTYPLVYNDATNVLAASLNTRTRYPVTVHTNVGDGVFQMNRRLACSRCTNAPASLPITTTVATNGGF